MFSPDSPRCPIVPRPGESLTSAIFREYDRFHGSGLSATDQAAVICADRAALERQLDQALKLNAELLADRDALRADLSDAHELIASLQDELAALRPCFVGGRVR